MGGEYPGRFVDPLRPEERAHVVRREPRVRGSEPKRLGVVCGGTLVVRVQGGGDGESVQDPGRGPAYPRPDRARPRTPAAPPPGRPEASATRPAPSHASASSSRFSPARAMACMKYLPSCSEVAAVQRDVGEAESRLRGIVEALGKREARAGGRRRTAPRRGRPPRPEGCSGAGFRPPERRSSPERPRRPRANGTTAASRTRGREGVSELFLVRITVLFGASGSTTTWGTVPPFCDLTLDGIVSIFEL